MAKWIEKRLSAWRTDYFCSNCGKMALSPSYWECDLEKSLYCPHCGEKMDNGEETKE